MKSGNLFIVSGPSGAGKSTVCAKVSKEIGIKLAVSATTRAPRAGEVEGVSYYFLTVEEFERKIKNNEFLEYAKVHNNYYGTPISEVEENINNFNDILLEIDVQGGLLVKEKYPDSHLIFFKTNNLEELKERLKNRNTDTEEIIQKRLKNSLKESEYESQYDHTIINTTIEQSCKDLKDIIVSKYRNK